MLLFGTKIYCLSGVQPEISQHVTAMDKTLLSQVSAHPRECLTLGLTNSEAKKILMGYCSFLNGMDKSVRIMGIHEI